MAPVISCTFSSKVLFNCVKFFITWSLCVCVSVCVSVIVCVCVCVCVCRALRWIWWRPCGRMSSLQNEAARRQFNSVGCVCLQMVSPPRWRTTRSSSSPLYKSPARHVSEIQWKRHSIFNQRQQVIIEQFNVACGWIATRPQLQTLAMAAVTWQTRFSFERQRRIYESNRNVKHRYANNNSPEL